MRRSSTKEGMAMSANGALESSVDDGVDGEHCQRLQETMRAVDDGMPISSVVFDPLHELLWVGGAKGRLSAFSQPDMRKLASIKAHDGDVRQIRCWLEGVISISESAVRMHSRTCLPLCAAPADSMLSKDRPEKGNDGPFAAGGEQFTCGALNSLATGVPLATTAAYQATQLTVGGNSTTLWNLDLVTGLNVVSKVEVPCGTAAVECNRSLIVAGVDGKLRFFDGLMRSERIERTLDAFTGPVSAICTWGDMLVACGTAARSLNPYDQSGLAPVQHYPDPLIKVFDLRMMCQTPPLSFSPALVAPSVLALLRDRLIVGSAAGTFLACDPYQLTQTDTQFFQAVNETGHADPISCIATSFSGDLVAFGTHDGCVVQWARGHTPCVNTPGRPPPQLPLVPSPPPVSVSPDDPAPASRYVMRPITQTYLGGNLLSSSFVSTPDFMDLVIRTPPRRCINPAILQKMSMRQDYLGFVPNSSNLPLNSLLFGAGAKEAYVVLDPRKRQKPSTADGDAGQGDGEQGEGSGGDKERGVEGAEKEYVPPRYRSVAIDFSKRGLDGFDFSRFNRSYLCGLENLLPNTYTNAVLQLLFYVPEVRLALLKRQYDASTFLNDKSLTCELGFLFHMLDCSQAQALEPKQPPLLHLLLASPPQPVMASPLPCQSTNFLRVFRQSPESVALGLLETKTSPVLQRAEAFHRFILSHVHAELMGPAEEEDANADTDDQRARRGSGGDRLSTSGSGSRKPKHPLWGVIDTLYGYTVRTNNSFPTVASAGVKFTETRTFVTNLNAYSQPAEGKAQRPDSGEAIPFCQLLQQSLCRVARSRGWCEETRSYEPLKQVRQPVSLPLVLALQCGIHTSAEAGAMWRQKNQYAGHWLPEKIKLVTETRPLQHEQPENGSSANERYLTQKLLVLEHQVGGDVELEQDEAWLGYDGKAVSPAALEQRTSSADGSRVVKNYELMSIVSFVAGSSASPLDDGHLVLHVKVPKRGSEALDEQDKWEWYIINDFVLEKVSIDDVLDFTPSWKAPSIILYREERSALGAWTHWSGRVSLALQYLTHMPASVFDVSSLSQAPDLRPSFTGVPHAQLPGAEHIIGFDAEFVDLEKEQSNMQHDGTRVLLREARQALARLSVIDDRTGAVIVDDYVLPSEPVVDYLTRFSGITHEDLDPSTSRHHLVTGRAAYLKLRFLVDRGCIFVGHGLRKDFRTINIFVPAHQIIDTVELWSLKEQRKMSLRFLTSHLLGQHIQSETHDSIEDARSALFLYKKYIEEVKQGTFEKTLNDLYDVGRRTHWKLL